MAQRNREYVTFREIAKDCERHPKKTGRDASGYLEALLALFWRGELSLKGKSIVYLDYDALRTDYHRIDRKFLRRIIGFWPREQELFRSLHETEKMTDCDWEKLAAVPVENIPASVLESSIEPLSFQFTEIQRWIMHNISIEWLAHWWRTRAGDYGYEPTLSPETDARTLARELSNAAMQNRRKLMRKDLVSHINSHLELQLTVHSALSRRLWKDEIDPSVKQLGSPRAAKSVRIPRSNA